MWMKHSTPKTTPEPIATGAAHQCVPALSLLFLQAVSFAGVFITATNTVKRLKNRAPSS